MTSLCLPLIHNWIRNGLKFYVSLSLLAFLLHCPMGFQRIGIESHAAAPAPAQKPLSPEERLTLQTAQAGLDAYRAKNYPLAESKLTQALLRPQDMPVAVQKQVYQLLIDSLKQQKKWAPLETVIEKALPLYKAPKSADDNQALGQLYLIKAFAQMSQKQLEAASSNFISALDLILKILTTKITPQTTTETHTTIAHAAQNYNALLFNLSNILYQYRTQNKIQEALSLFDSLNPYLNAPNTPLAAGMIELYAHQGSLHYNEKHYAQALNSYRKGYDIAHKLNDFSTPNWPLLLEYLGQSAYITGDYSTAQQAYQELLVLNKTKLVLNAQEKFKIQQLLSDLASIDNGQSYIQLLGQNITRWNDDMKTLTIYLPDAEEAKAGSSLWTPELDIALKKAFSEWSNVLGNRLSFAYTTDPKKYDVRIIWGNKSEDNSKISPEENKLGYSLTSTWGEYIARSDIYFYLQDHSGEALSEQKFYNTCLHEIGHMLGIHTHSPNPDDIMFKSVHIDESKIATLSPRDIETMRALYQLPPSVSNPQGVYLSEFEKFRKKQMADLDCMDAPVITLNFNIPGGYAGQQKRLVCRKKAKPRDLIPVYIPMFGF
ncbi:MAG: matrixin family metalloprotease [Vampirovibrionales bacterium]|nr:matrixin family metalloprotease [Vampirovibrionales bacterium]